METIIVYYTPDVVTSSPARTWREAVCKQAEDRIRSYDDIDMEPERKQIGINKFRKELEDFKRST
jgi:hypothetical protein